jgi:hypothetical protein
LGIDNTVQVRKAQLRPLGCYLEGKDFLGDQYWNFVGICLVGLLLGGIVPLFLYGPAMCGIALCFLQRARGERTQFDQLFKGFDYFMPSLIATLIYVGVFMALAVPYMIFVVAIMAMLASEAPVLMMVAGLLLICAYIGWIFLAGFAAMVFMFAAILIVDKKLEGPAAMMWAWKGVLKNFWGVVGCSIVGQLMILIGMMFCIVPGILAIPIFMAGHFVAYQKIFGVSKAEPVMAEPIKNLSQNQVFI